jgi:hypothetical protein
VFSVVAILTECRFRAPLLHYVLKRANDLEATIVVSHGVGNDVNMFEAPAGWPGLRAFYGPG